MKRKPKMKPVLMWANVNKKSNKWSPGYLWTRLDLANDYLLDGERIARVEIREIGGKK